MFWTNISFFSLFCNVHACFLILIAQADIAHTRQWNSMSNGITDCFSFKLHHFGGMKQCHWQIFDMLLTEQYSWKQKSLNYLTKQLLLAPTEEMSNTTEEFHAVVSLPLLFVWLLYTKRRWRRIIIDTD